MISRYSKFAALMGLGFLLSSAGLAAQGTLQNGESASSTKTAAQRVNVRLEPPILQAVRIDGDEPSIDGILDEEIWTRAAVARDFVQFRPDEGVAPSEDTEVRIVYGDDALFVGFHAFDREPNEIVGRLTRRDQIGFSDKLTVIVDSYFDRRTAFEFAVNPVGVKGDVYRFDDTNEDSSWDAVWDVATQVVEDGWTAEFRIPYSQLRFGDAQDQTWGINFARDIARHNETSVWAPLSSQDNAIVSRFGELRGIAGLQAPRRLEVLPYTVARLTRSPGDENDPFYQKNDPLGSVGADLKFGVTSNLTLDVTINPDFGQVEADPGQVNLTAFESFFQERRPFFVEGGGIFRFGLQNGDGDGASETLFYSRRIGRAPQGFPSTDGYADWDGQTRILGAWKLSGKTASGWSIGALHAVTGEEMAKLSSLSGVRTEESVEPFSNYGVVRVQKDFREGRSAFGIIGTATNRNKEAADALQLRSGGYTGGLDFRHRFGNENWQVSGYVLGSHVRGSEEAILRTQRAPARYMQRPDADYVEVDPTRTSLSGWAANASVSKFAGGFWRIGTGVLARSAGFEVNDLGFMNETDYVSPWLWAAYHKSVPGKYMNNWNLNVNSWTGYTLGGDRTSIGGNVNGSFTLKSFWGGYAGINHQFENFSTDLLRGGPLYVEEPSWSGWFGAFSDGRRAIQASLNNNWGARPESDSHNFNVNGNLRWRPSERATVTMGGFSSWNVNDRQWVGTSTIDDEVHYVLGRIEQQTVGVTTRVDYSFSANLSLQLYAQPFVSGGDYEDFKVVTDPRGESYEDRFRRFDARFVDEAGSAGDVVKVLRGDVDGDGTAEVISNRDFNFGQFRSNAVLRWEYRPGSALFLVWSQGRDRFQSDGAFEVNRDLDRLFDVHPQNVFLIKASYWFNP